MPPYSRTHAFSRVTAIAGQRPVHAAFAWMHGNPKTIMDWQAEWFQEFCREQRRERRARVHRMVERLAALGMPLAADEVFAIVRTRTPRLAASATSSRGA